MDTHQFQIDKGPQEFRTTRAGHVALNDVDNGQAGFEEAVTLLVPPPVLSETIANAVVGALNVAYIVDISAPIGLLREKSNYHVSDRPSWIDCAKSSTVFLSTTQPEPSSYSHNTSPTSSVRTSTLPFVKS